MKAPDVLKLNKRVFKKGNVFIATVMYFQSLANN